LVGEAAGDCAGAPIVEGAAVLIEACGPHSVDPKTHFAAWLAERLRERAPEFLSALEGLSESPDCAVFDRLFLDFDLRASQSTPTTLADGREVGTLHLVAVVREGCPAALRTVYRDLGIHDAGYAPA
jgi:hypothetical protein